MKYLVDTNVVIDYLRGREKVVLRVNQLIDAGLAISTISLSELYHGANKTSIPSRIITKIDSFVGIPEIKLLVVDRDIAKVYGQLMSELESKGMKLSGIDVLIASTAKFFGLLILTGDKRHFVRLKDFWIKIELV